MLRKKLSTPWSAAGKTVKSERGQLGPLFIVVTIIIGIAVGALAVDFSHMSTVRSELHAATDAAALAGAHDLWTNVDLCASDAYAVAALNSADGKVISNDTPGVTVNATVTPPNATTRGQVQVDASVQVKHMFAPFFERWTDTINVTSIAGTQGKLWQLAAGQGFPLAVSVDQAPTDNQGNVLGLPLYQMHSGDSISLYIGSQAFKNSAWTSLSSSPASASTLNSMIDEILGLQPKKEADIPAVTLGQQINVCNGVQGQKDLTKDPENGKLINLPYIVVPVVASTYPLANPPAPNPPPYNQQLYVVGFTCLKNVSVTTNAGKGMVMKITGTLTNMPQVEGESGPIYSTGNTTVDQGLSGLTPGPIQLIQ